MFHVLVNIRQATSLRTALWQGQNKVADDTQVDYSLNLSSFLPMFHVMFTPTSI
jgi:hypothetical protein